ncbi:hypothetical protein OTU49_004849 [Cherax quadricarinatus]|uniref:Protein kinase domain-containing protein n=1 Tax=Cherax quadricarinatus TaxID=27406 RepID=A0AAW0WV18_CHEQU
MAEQQQQQQQPGLNRLGSLGMPCAVSGRRSNLRLAFPGQGRLNNDRPQNNLEFPASGYPTTQIGKSIASVPPPRDKITRGIYQSIQSSGKLKISPELQVEFTADDLRDLGEIGRGGFGTVNKMVHRKSNTIMAVKVVSCDCGFVQQWMRENRNSC